MGPSARAAQPELEPDHSGATAENREAVAQEPWAQIPPFGSCRGWVRAWPYARRARDARHAAVPSCLLSLRLGRHHEPRLRSGRGVRRRLGTLALMRAALALLTASLALPCSAGERVSEI